MFRKKLFYTDPTAISYRYLHNYYVTESNRYRTSHFVLNDDLSNSVVKNPTFSKCRQTQEKYFSFYMFS